MSNLQKTIKNPWTNVYGLARSFLALGTLVTLLVNDLDYLFKPLGSEVGETSLANFFTNLSIFSFFSDEYLIIAKWLSIFILFGVLIDWRPRVTGILHWWVSASLAVSCIIIDGGDQVTANLTLFLIPVTLADSRKWHWSNQKVQLNSTYKKITALFSNSCFMIIRIQVAVIYLMAGVSKLGVSEWANGTALYYWFTNPVFGMPDPLVAIFMPFLTNEITMTFLTWGVIGLELVLFSGLFMKEKYRPMLLISGILFHIGIWVVHGLFSFFWAMAAALILYLHPVNQPFNFQQDFFELITLYRHKKSPG